jgi:hypothetical protein
MKKLKTLLCISVISTLTACGGGSETTNTPIIPVIDNPIDLTVVDFVGASSIFLTGDDGSATANNIKNLSRSISPMSNSTGSVTIKNKALNAEEFTPNTLYKILANGTFESVPLNASGDDVRGAVTPYFVKSIGNGWTAISIAVEQVQRVTQVMGFEGSIDYYVDKDDLLYTYLVNNDTGKAFRADFLATPILDYNKGEFGVYERADNMVDDLRATLELNDKQKSNIFKSISFDGAGDMYVLGRVADEGAYEINTANQTTKEVFLKINTSDTASSSLTATEIPIVFNGDIDYDSFNISNNGNYLTFKDSAYRSTSTQTNETYLLKDSNGNPINYIFTVKGSGNVYAVNYIGWGLSVHELKFSESGLSIIQLSAAPEPAQFDFPEDVQFPSSNNVQTVNGHIVIGGKGHYLVFDETTNTFVQQVRLTRYAMRVLDTALTERSIFSLLKLDNGLTEIIKWTPDPFMPKKETVSVMPIPPELFKIHSINKSDDNYLSFTATIINPLEGNNIGDIVLARTSLLVSNAETKIQKVFSFNEPLIISMLEISRGDTISVDGQVNDWSIDTRVITDTIGDTISGDLAFVSMVENSNNLWFLIEADTVFTNIQTSLNLSATKKIIFLNNDAYFVSNGSMTRLNNQLGVFAVREKNIEVSIPKELLAEEALLISVTTAEILGVEGTGHIYEQSISNDVAQVTLSLESAIGGSTVEITMLGEVSVVITEPTTGNYNVLVNTLDIATFGGSVEVVENKITFSVSLTNLGLDGDQFKKVGASITSNPLVTLGNLLDEAI